MTRVTKADLARESQLQAAFEAGFNHFREDPETDMTTIHRRASNIYPDDKSAAFYYADGYLAARLQHDEYRKERGSRS